MSTGNLRTFIVPHVTGQTFRRNTYISSSAGALDDTGVEAEIIFKNSAGETLLRCSTDSPTPDDEGTITITELAAAPTADPPKPYQYLRFQIYASATDAEALENEARGFLLVTWSNGDITPYMKLQIGLESL